MERSYVTEEAFTVYSIPGMGNQGMPIEAGEYLSFQSIQRAQQGISRITFSSLAEGFDFLE